jgi:hypothetical protein
MTRNTALYIVLGFITVSVFYSTANAQTFSHRSDTGVIDLAPGQVLRIAATGSGSEAATVQFRKMEYVESGIADGVVRKQVGSQTTTAPMTLAGDQCLVFFVVASGAGVRLQLFSTSQNLTAKAFVVSPAGGSGGTAMEEISLTYQKIELSR